MTSFLNGADCGPSNALKQVSGRLERDVGISQDRLVSVPNTASSSRQAFNRPAQANSHQGFGRSPVSSSPAFDVSTLRAHLPSPVAKASPLAGSAQSNWADSFLPQAGPSYSNGQHDFRPQPQQQSYRPAVAQTAIQAGAAPWQREFERSMALNQGPPPHHQQHQHQQHYHPRPTGPTIFQRTNLQPYAHHMAPEPFFDYEPPQNSQISHMPPQTSQEETTRTHSIHSHEPDLTDSQEVLARTASAFTKELSENDKILRNNPKLAQSQFMQLVQALGDKQVVVEDGKAAENGEEVGIGASFVPTSRNSEWAEDFGRISSGSSQPSTSQHQPISSSAQIPGMNGITMHQPPHLMPPSTGASQTSARGANSQSAWDQQFADQEAILMSEKKEQPGLMSAKDRAVHFDFDAQEEETKPLGNGIPSTLGEALRSSTSIPGATEAWQNSAEDIEDQFDMDSFLAFNGPLRTAYAPNIGVGAMEGWGEMQKDWDQFTRTQPVSKIDQALNRLGPDGEKQRYLFQRGNPYTAGVVDAERFGRESPTIRGVLELEGEVQANPSSQEAWFTLGLKQQENEREDQAILALTKVIQLDPQHRPAYLALAVSYTNEGQRASANTMLEKWIELGESGQASLDQGDILAAEAKDRNMTTKEKRDNLVSRLIDIACRSPDEVDPDVQIALGVMFNASEEYHKAEDCFLAALSVRPDDWLLYNRLGATLANSGRSSEAVEYYYKALALHPNFVRALFNLGISYINLTQYDVAAQRILDALRLQHADATEGYASSKGANVSTKGVTSEVLWTTLKTACMHLGRQDLVELVTRKDLSGFPASLSTE